VVIDDLDEQDAKQFFEMAAIGLKCVIMRRKTKQKIKSNDEPEVKVLDIL